MCCHIVKSEWEVYDVGRGLCGLEFCLCKVGEFGRLYSLRSHIPEAKDSKAQSTFLP